MNKKPYSFAWKLKQDDTQYAQSECVYDDAIALNKHLLVGLSLFAFIVYGFVSPNVLIIIIFFD